MNQHRDGDAIPKIGPGTILVAGGGSAGVGAAWEAALRGWKVILVEQEPCLGGMGRSILHNGNYYDLGTHIFHSDNSILLQRIKDATKGKLIESRQKIRIKWDGRFYRYPLSAADLLKKLPLSVLIPCGLSFLKAQAGQVFRGEAGSAEEQLIRDYGKRLYEIFFRDYTERHWGIPASRLDPGLVKQRILRTDLFGFLARLTGLVSRDAPSHSRSKEQPVAEELYYTEQGSGGLFHLLRKELERHGVEILTGCRLLHLENRNGRITGALCEGQEGRVEVDCEAVISTLPLDRVHTMVDSASSQAVEPLDVRSLIISGLLVKREAVLDANFVYFQDAFFGRVSEPKRVGLSVTPEDHTILLCEVACSQGDERWQDPDGVTDQVIQGLVREGCLHSTSEVVDRISIPVACAYPVYRKGYLDKVRVLQDRLQAFPNLFSAGRWGEFRYINMHVAMLSGMRAAEEADDFLRKQERSAGD